MANEKGKGKGKDIVPSLDEYQYDHSLFQNININDFKNDPHPTFADLWQSEGPSTNSSSLPQHTNGNGQGHENTIGANGTLYDNNPFSDPMIQQWGTSSINSGGNFEAGLSEVHGQKTHQHPNGSNLSFNIDPFSDPMMQDLATSSINQGGSFETGPPEHHREISLPYPNGPVNSSGTIPPLLWPESPLPSFCDSCSILREIVHTNGDNIIKLEIHGRVGIIRHAIQKQITNNGAYDSQIFDLSEKSYEEIKIFLTTYFLQHKSSGYNLMHDPLSPYYEALCVGLDLSTGLNDEPRQNLGALSPNVEQEVEAEVVVEGAPRKTMAIQRERVGKMKLKDFTDYFHLPIEDAAKKVNLCPTVVKKICRKEGLKRWPHRKLKALVKQISGLEQHLNSENPELRVRTQEEIDKLQEKMIQHCGGICPTLIDEG